jgi:membrane dipeptidase
VQDLGGDRHRLSSSEVPQIVLPARPFVHGATIAGAVCTAGCFDHWVGLAALSRRQFLAGAAALPVVAAGCASRDPRAGRGVLDETFSVDLHAHPALIPSLASKSVDGHGRAMAEGHVGAVFMAAVADAAVLGRRPNGGIYATREPNAGELHASTSRQLDTLERSATQMGMHPVRTAADFAVAAAARQRASILAVEGADFLDGRLERLGEAHARGVRSVQLVHYRVNELGDIQTESPVHNRLTPFGRQVVAEMNRLGMVVDLAHATFDTVKGAVEASSKPMIASHTNVTDHTGFARYVTREHAQLIASAGGVVGAWPISIRPAGFDQFFTHIERLVDAVGIDHVGIGTDMDGIGRAALFTDYADWPSIPAGLLARGFAPADVAKVMGGNVARLLHAVGI